MNPKIIIEHSKEIEEISNILKDLDFTIKWDYEMIKNELYYLVSEDSDYTKVIYCFDLFVEHKENYLGKWEENKMTYIEYIKTFLNPFELKLFEKKLKD